MPATLSVSAGVHPVRGTQREPSVEHHAAVLVTVAVGDPERVGQIDGDLPERHHGVPVHGGRDVAARGLGQPRGAVPEQRRGPPHHRVRGVLQVDDPWRIPRAGRAREVLGRRPEPHLAAPADHREDRRRARVPARGQGSVQRVGVRRAHPEHPVGLGAGIVDTREGGLGALGAEALAEREQPRPPVGGHLLDAGVHGVEQGPALGRGARAVDDERQPARQVRVLGGDDRRVPAPDHLQGVGRRGVDPAGARGGDDGEHRPVERPGAFQLGDGQGGALRRPGRREQADVGADRRHRGTPRRGGELGGWAPARDDGLALAPDRVPAHQRGGRAGAQGRGRGGEPGVRRVVRGAEDGVGHTQPTAQDHRVEHRDDEEQHEHGAGDGRDPAGHVDVPTQQLRDAAREPAHPAPEADEHARHDHRDRSGAQPAVGRRLLEAHEPGDLPLPAGTGEEQTEQGERRGHHEHQPRPGREPHGGRAVQAVGEVRPARHATQEPGEGHADRVAQGGGDAGGEALEEVVAGDQRRRQRDEPEGGAQHEARGVRARDVADPRGEARGEQRRVGAELVALAVAVPEVVVVELVGELLEEHDVELVVGVPGRVTGRVTRGPGGRRARRPHLPVRHGLHSSPARKAVHGTWPTPCERYSWL